jgi:hypothetical protein
MSKDAQVRRAAQHAKRDQQLKDIETSVGRAAELTEESRREVARSQQLARDADALSDRIDANRERLRRRELA